MAKGIVKCPHCGSTNVIKLGFVWTPKRKQRYLCKNCAKTFVEDGRQKR